MTNIMVVDTHLIQDLMSQNLSCIQVHRVFCLWSCMSIKLCVWYDGGFLPDMLLLVLRYYHRGTRLNAMERFCLCLQPMFPPTKRFDSFPPCLGDARLDAFRFFFKL